MNTNNTMSQDVPLNVALRQIGGELVTGKFIAYQNNSDSKLPEQFRYTVVAAQHNPETIAPFFGNNLAEIARSCNKIRRNMLLCYGKTRFE